LNKIEPACLPPYTHLSANIIRKTKIIEKKFGGGFEKHAVKPSHKNRKKVA